MGKQLPSPDPGFREPRRVKLHYFVGQCQRMDAQTARTRSPKQRSPTTTSATNALNSPKLRPVRLLDFLTKKKAPAKNPTKNLVKNPWDNPSPDEKKDAKEPSGETQADEEQPADDESSRLPGPSPFRLAAFQEDAEAEAEESETASEESPKEEPATEAAS